MIAAARVLAFVNLLFLPAIATLVFVGAVTGSTGWFLLFGVPALIGNCVILLIEPARSLVWTKLNAIAGVAGRA